MNRRAGMAMVVPIRGAREAPRAQQSKMETILVTPAMVSAWQIPPFQRPLAINAKVRAVAEKLKHDDGCIEGVITLGKLRSDSTVYIVDGQHRIYAFKISELPEGIADVRVMTFDTMADMADEFVRLNSSLVRMRPDDVLRGLEGSVPALAKIRKACEFVGYDNIRRSATSAPMLGMSQLLRCWQLSTAETPAGGAGVSAQQIATSIDDASVSNLIAFLSTAYAAWGRDPEYYRLWGNLNLTLCMWLWRKLVLERERGVKRYVVLNAAQFKNCLMSLSADSDYLSYLVGRVLNERDRSPCYNKIKMLFAKRLRHDAPNTKPLLPQPAWSASRGQS